MNNGSENDCRNGIGYLYHRWLYLLTDKKP